MKPLTLLATVTLVAALFAGCAPSTGGLGPVGSAAGADASVAAGSPDLTPGPGASSSESIATGPAPTPAATPGTTAGTGPGATPAVTPSPTPGATDRPTPAPATPAPQPAEPVSVRAYFHLAAEDGTTGLVPILRQISSTPAVARAALTALLEGPLAAERNRIHPISTAIPSGTRLLDVAIAGGVATVDLSREFESGGGSGSSFGRLGQIVYT
jgi:hypothetical protein